MLALSVEDRFHSDLVGLPRDQQRKILRAIADMRRDPSHLTKPLEGIPGVWRRRVDPYRILFTKAPGWIHVYSVQHRQGVYHGTVASPQQAPQSWDLALRELPVQPAPADGEATQPTPVAALGQSCWDVAWKVVDCRSDDDVLTLIDAGAPAGLIDRLSLQLESQRRESRAVGLVQLVRQNVLDAFFGRLLLLGEAQRPTELLVAAPWLTPWVGPRSSLDGLMKFLGRRGVRTTILTRPPEMASHISAIDRLRGLDCVQIVYVPGLHAKFFICDVAPIPFALVASANTTAKSYSNWEVGVFVRGSGEAESFIRELQGLAVDLVAAGKLNKRRSIR